MKTLSLVVTAVILLFSCSKDDPATPKTPDAYYISFKIEDSKFNNISYAAFAVPNDIFKPDSIINEQKIDITSIFANKQMGDKTPWFKVESKFIEPKKEWNLGVNRSIRFYYTTSTGEKFRTQIYTFAEDSVSFGISGYNTVKF